MLLVLNELEKIDFIKCYEIYEYYDDYMLNLSYKRNAKVGVHG